MKTPHAATRRVPLDELYHRYAAHLVTVARGLLDSRADAEDLVQDVFVEAWLKQELFSPTRGTHLAWLTWLTRRRAIDRMRARQRRDRLVIGHGSLEPSPPHIESRPDVKRLYRALANLNPQQRQAILLIHFVGLNYREAAEHAKVPVSTLKTRVALAVKRLAKILFVKPKPCDARRTFDIGTNSRC